MVLIVEKPQDLLHLVGTRVGPSGWIAVEQDVCRRDAFDCLRASIGYLRGLGL